MNHGGSGSGYTNDGCRCAECTRANTDRVKRRKRERATEPKDPHDLRHGTYTFYNNHGCRCAACKASERARWHMRYERRKAAQ